MSAPQTSLGRGSQVVPKLTLVALAGLATTMLASTSPAAVLLLDFGNGAGYAGTNDPAHADGTVSGSYTTWSSVSTGSGTTSTTDSAGHSIVIDPARCQSGSNANNSLDLGSIAPSMASSASGSGIFATDLTKDALIDISGSARDPVGAFISGLPAGSYYVYVVAHYAGNIGTKTLNVLADATAVTGDGTGNEFGNVYDFAKQDTLEGANSTSWQLGDNYARFTIDLTTAKPNLIVATDSSQTIKGNSSIAAIMITPVPEPGSATILASLLWAGSRRRRRAV